MAIEKNIELDYGTSYGKYHVIAKIEAEYTNMQVNAYVRHYADASYRREEKEELIAIKRDIARIKELEAKEETELTDDEKEEKLRLISSQVQEARRVKDRSLTNVTDTKYTFEFEDDSEITRESLYKRIMTLDEYKKAKEV